MSPVQTAVLLVAIFAFSFFLTDSSEEKYSVLYASYPFSIGDN